MKNEVELDRLAILVKSKRGNRGLRDIAEEIGSVSASTLSRVENGKMPDLETFLTLCDWLAIPAAQLIKSTPGTQSSDETNPADEIAIQLRASKNLDPETASALANLVRAVSRQPAVEKQEKEKAE